MQHPLEILERYWNFTSFRPNQEAIINAVIAGEDTFALLPTGGGKSLCFQIPALAKEGICIVISPLIALMKSQVSALNLKGIKAIALTSGIPFAEIDTLLDNCIYGNYKFLYLSPERLQQDIVQDRIRLMNVNLIAVDEAHCISQWGNDFRPSYRNIKQLRELKPSANIIALTATAKSDVVEDIIKELDFIQPKLFKQSFVRPNLAFLSFSEADKLYRLELILKQHSSSSIVYVRSRKLTVEISQTLAHKGISSTYYHGGLSNREKDDHLQAWMNNQKQVMVATNAFGMGIDKPDVETVIHLNLPDSIESYFQEAGRAGRNGDAAFAIILKNKNDEIVLKNQFLDVLPDEAFIKIVYRKLCNYFQISYGEGVYATFNFDFNHFCKTYKFNSIKTYNAIQFLDRTSIINLSRQFNKQTVVQFIVNNETIFRYLEIHTSYNSIVKSMLRTYGGIANNPTNINTSRMAEKASITESVLQNALIQLEKDAIITLDLKKTDAQVTFIEPREDDKTINRVVSILNQQNELKQNQVQAVLDFINNERICKSMQLLAYFGEVDIKACGICSVCNSNETKVDETQLQKDIINQLEKHQLSSRGLSEHLSYSEVHINRMLKKLLEHQIITITKTNTYKLFHS